MKSPSSGYITVGRNLTRLSPYVVTTQLLVPVGHAIMVSFKETGPFLAGGVTLYGPSSWLWGRHHLESDFAQVFTVSDITVQVERNQCLMRRCFRLWFTFLPENSLQRVFPGVYNCSAKSYSSFRHHVDCNLKPECEDGRDETEHCSFSSAECQGRLALCNRCYSIFKPLPISSHTYQSSQEYCKSLGGELGIPKCLPEWYRTVQSFTWIHPERLCHLWVGLLVNDMSLPFLYRYVVTGNKTVFHHAVHSSYTVSAGVQKCLMTHYRQSRLISQMCLHETNVGAFCEFQSNQTQHLPQTQAVSLPPSQALLSTAHHNVTVCQDGQVTYTFLLCGYNQHNLCEQQQQQQQRLSGTDVVEPFVCSFGSREHHNSQIPTFTCDDEIHSLSPTMVCDFIPDCQDRGDETFCKHPVCEDTFTCNDGQCVPFDEVCDRIYHCVDQSDEESCEQVRRVAVTVRTSYIPSPALITFDHHLHLLVSTKLKSNESCPDSHFRCPGDFKDCLPVYTRCNTMHDCLDHQDEEDCDDFKCPGLFRCRAHTTCIHSDNLCDGWSHCPNHDDELACGVTCPLGCLCQGYAFLCHRPLSAALFLQLRHLDATGSGMTLSDVSSNIYLVYLVLAKCSLSSLPDITLKNLRSLDLRENKLVQFNITSFVGFENLQELSLSNNPVSSIYSSVSQLKALAVVDVSFTTLTVLNTQVFSSFPGLQKLNLTYTSLHTISSAAGFPFTPQLAEIHLVGSPVKTYPQGLFADLSQLRTLSAGNYKLCCTENLPQNFDSSFCHAPKAELSSCKDLLQSWTYRGFLWLATCLSLAGNVVCFSVRVFAKGMSSVGAYSVFVTNLTMADFLMGIYIAIIGVADERFRSRYIHYDEHWKDSVTCKAAGCLSLLSSEVSALIIWLITLDRFIVLRFPFSTFRFKRRSASVVCLLMWLTGWFLALFPLLPQALHWEFYSQTGMCVPLPITNNQFKGRLYSFSVLIILNFVLFVLISAGQGFIYWSIQNNRLKTSSTKLSQDLTIARRLITVALTDFLCWFPIGLCGMLAAAGVAISGEINVALAVFVLPLNSAVNPFVYTFNTLAEKRRKSKETKFLAWLKSHTEVVGES